MRRDDATATRATLAVLALAVAFAAPSLAQTRSARRAAVAGPDATSETSASDVAAQRKRAEYGIALAMSGEYRDAESAFVSLLSVSPGDPRALANLGNLRVLNGDLDVAMAFYDQALRSDPEDAGIVLNRATTWMLMGEVDRAESEAARGVTLAGGEAEAARLLGIAGVKLGGPRASDKPYVSKQEIRALLRAATSRVPGDSIKASTSSDSTKSETKTKRATKAWRSAGPRAGDGGEIASLLYWKR